MIAKIKKFIFTILLTCLTVTLAEAKEVPDSFPGIEELNEIVVKRKREKYSKKNNPAVDFMVRLRTMAHDSDPLKENFYSFDKYEKTVLGTYLPENAMPDSTVKPYVDYNPLTGRSYLTLSLKEKIAKEIHSRNPKHAGEIVDAYRSVGIDESFDADNMRKMLDDVMREINLYSNDITLMQQRFVSPLSRIGPDFYKYYLTDTVQIGGEPCIELVFGPHNRESLGFSGRIYVPLADTTMFVKKIVLQTPKAANLNFIDRIYVVQNFVKDSLGNRNKVSEQLTVDFSFMKDKPLLYARREIANRNFCYERDAETDKFCQSDDDIKFHDLAMLRNEDYWTTLRPLQLSLAQQSMPGLMPSLRKKKWFYWGEKFISLMERGYLHTGVHSKFDIGPLNTLASYNSVEGLRLRLGGMTTAWLSDRIFARGYGAYGFHDKKWKYKGELEYSFIKKKYHAREFPMHLIRGEYQYDIDHIGQHYLFTNPDNAFLSLTRKKSILATYRRHAALTYIIERKSGFSFEASANWERQEATRWLPFITTTGANINNFSNAYLSVTFRYAPGEVFYQSASMRKPINMDAPVIQLTQEWGAKGFLGSDFAHVKTELSAMKRIWFSAFGYLDAIIRGANIWSSVYYPALTWANANLSYTIQPESYSLMNPMEFATDKYFSWDLTYWGMGILFNRLPFIKKAGLREVITYKGYYGSLSRRNNPEYNSKLLKFPSDAKTGLMNAGPYMELGVGIDNIFKVLRVDYVWRLTYRNNPEADKSGLRIALHFSF